MRVYFFLATFIAASCVYLGIEGLRGWNKKKARRLFLCMCVSLAWFLVCAGFTVSETESRGMLFWYQLSSFGFVPFFALNLHFYIQYVYDALRGRLLSLLYLPVPLLIGATYVSRSLFKDFAWERGSWRFHPAYDSFWFWLYILYFVSYTAVSIVMVFRYAKKASSRTRRERTRFVARVTAVTLCVGTGFDFILTSFSWFSLPPLGPLIMGLYAGGLWFALLRYDFLGPSSRVLLDKVLSHVRDYMFVLDKSLGITWANRRVLSDFVAFSEGLEKEISFCELTPHPRQTRLKFQELEKQDILTLHAVFQYQTRSGPLCAETYVAKILGPDRELEGYAVISREHKTRTDFMKTFKITDREMEIVDLCMEGKGNPEIAARMDISIRTVESHLEHIYNKCGVDNKIELYNLGFAYSLLPHPIKFP